MQILADGNNLAMAAYSTTRNLKTSTGIPTGVTYTTTRMLKALLSKIPDVARVIVAWDRQPSWREESFPEYKANRRDREYSPDDTYLQQRDQLKRILPLMGVDQISAQGYEADDVAGDFVRRNEDVVLVSNDDDWLQLVGPTVSLFQPRKKDLVTFENFDTVSGCATPEEFVKVKALMGDAGDNVPGAVGIGKATAIKFLRGRITDPTTAKKKVCEDWMSDSEGFQRSFELVNLRGTRILDELLEVVPGSIDGESLVTEFTQLQFNSVLKDLEGWLKPFVDVVNRRAQ